MHEPFQVLIVRDRAVGVRLYEIEQQEVAHFELGGKTLEVFAFFWLVVEPVAIEPFFEYPPRSVLTVIHSVSLPTSKKSSKQMRSRSFYSSFPMITYQKIE